jgi:DNA topoisomerase-2
LDEKRIRITELPVGTWTEDYKKFLEHLIEPVAVPASKDKDKDKDSAASNAPIVKEYNDMSTDTRVDITITMAPNIIKTYSEKATEFECNLLEKSLGLYTTQSTTNMNMFDAKEKLKKYSSAEEIIDDYYGVRLEYYEKRKQYILNALKRELLVLSNRARYITELLDDTIDLRRKTNKMLTTLLKERKYDLYVAGKGDHDDAIGGSSGSSGSSDADDENGYKYLLKLPMDSVSEENVSRLLTEKTKKEKELSELGSKSLEQLWKNDLEELETEYTKFVEKTALTEVASSATGETSLKSKLKSKSKSSTGGTGGIGGKAVKSAT